MGEIRTFAVQLGGEYRSGDPAKIPTGKVLNAKNVYIRPGRMEKRYPWVKTSGSTPNTPNTLFLKASNSQVFTLMSGAGTQGVASHSGGIWSDLGATYVEGTEGDYTNLGDTMYAAYKKAASPNEFTLVSDASGAPGQKNVAGGTVASLARRLFMGNVTERIDNLLTPAQSYKMTTGWVASAGIASSYLTSGNVKYSSITNTTGAAETLELNTGITTTADTWVTWQQGFFANGAPYTVPWTMSVRDSLGSTYSQLEFDIVTAIPLPDIREALRAVQIFTVAAFVPSGKTIVLRLAMGNTRTPLPPVNGGAYLAGRDLLGTLENTGAQLTEGRYNFPFIGSSWDDAATTWPTVVNTYSDRIAWSEPDDVSYVKAINFFDCKGVPGEIEAVRVGQGRLHAYKKRGIWQLRLNTDADNPLIFERTLEEFGCDNKRAIAVWENKHYFVDTVIGEVYEWDLSTRPKALAGDGLREYLFDSATRVTTPIVAIDPKNKELYCYIRQHKIHIFNLERREWSHVTVTGASDAELAISDLLYDGSTMWAIESATGTPIKLDSTATKDNITGTLRNVVSELIPKPIETDGPRQRVTVNFAWLRHKVSASQSGSTFRTEVSLNGGESYPLYNELGISPLSAGAVLRMQIPLRQTGEIVFTKFKHDGLAGPNYFNIYGLEYEVNVRGKAIPSSVPTQVISDLT